MLPFLVESTLPSARVFDMGDGRFRILEAGDVGPFIAGPGYLLVEAGLAELLIQAGVAGISVEPVVLVRASGLELRTHVRLRVEKRFSIGQIGALDLAGFELLTMDDRYYFASPALKDMLIGSRFDYLTFSQGVEGFAASKTAGPAAQ